MSAWIRAMRLRTLPLSLSGIVMGSAIAYYHQFWNPSLFSVAVSTTILFQILSNLANDLGDGVKGTDNDDRIGPERAVQSGLISFKEMKNAVVITAILSLVSAGVLIYISIQNLPSRMIYVYVVLAILCVIAAITYTVGKKAYGYQGLGDLMVFIFFGLVSVLGVYSLYTGYFIYENILPACTIGLLSAAVLNLNNMRDYANDTACNKHTLVVKMGPNLAKMYHASLIVLSIVSLGVFIGLFKEPLLYISMLPAVVLIVHLRKVMQTTEAKDFDPQLKVVALTTFFLSVSLWTGLIYLMNGSQLH